MSNLSNTSMMEIISMVCNLPRDIISDGYDNALDIISNAIPMKTHKYPTGTHCWSWIIPEKWGCRAAYLETMDGRRIFSYADNPLHVVSYSLPFNGIVDTEELFAHLHTHPKLKDAIPFKFKYYERDWGLCCSEETKSRLTDPEYKVRIDTEFSRGELKVGEVIIEGECNETFVLCTHLCHPCAANDGLSGVAVGIEVMKRLMKLPRPFYTYRFLILPETIGSIAYLSHNEWLIPLIKGGLFLEMLGLRNPHGLQLSYMGNTEADITLTEALKEYDPKGWTGGFRTIIGNDERQFNSPGVRAPMLSLSRVLMPDNTDWPFREYHTNIDNPDLVSEEMLEDSVILVLGMIEAFEKNLIPVNRFKGEIFCSRYNISADWYKDPVANKRFFDVMYEIDGTKSIAGIAQKTGIPFSKVYDIISKLLRHGLIEARNVHISSGG